MPEQVLLMDDPQAFLTGLVDAVARRLPRSVMDSAMTVVRRRSLTDRVSGGVGSITAIRLVTPGHRMDLDCSSGHHFVAETRRTVGGVALSRRTATLGQWLEEFAGRIAELAGDVAGAGGVADAGGVGGAAGGLSALQALGISVSGAGVGVGEETAIADLRALPFKVRGQLSPEAAAAVTRIAALLLDTLPRVAGNSDADAVTRRTAAVYLPETLGPYLALPTGWARGHVYPDGSTPDSALLAQLVVLEREAGRLHEAAVRGDADALLVNGRFLDYKFGD